MIGNILQRRTPTLMAGRLRHQIDIVRPSGAQDDTGGPVGTTTVVYAGVWATIEALSGTEQLAAGQFVSRATHQIVIRYLDGIDTSMHVVFQGRRFIVQAVLNPDERTKALVLECIEINGGQ
jgi:SPP1 family predicted phage head-tail adaptor